MWRKIQEVHPTLAEVGKFIDWKAYRLGGLQSEMRTEFKKEGMREVDQKSNLVSDCAPPAQASIF